MTSRENDLYHRKSNYLCNHSSQRCKIAGASLRLRGVCEEELEKVLKEQQIYT